MAPSFRKVSDSIGAEVGKVDLAVLEDSDAEEIAHALSQFGVLVFRGQNLDDIQHADFARHFGRLSRFRVGENGSFREIFRSANFDERGNTYPTESEESKLLRLNWLWHADGSYLSRPVEAVVLRCLEIPVAGGETEFADMVRAYEALPAFTKAALEGLVARHSMEFMLTTQGAPSLGEGAMPSARHPLVKLQADGRRSLFLSTPYMEGVEGLRPGEAAELIAGLLSWATQPRFTYVHQWRPGDILAWDNRWTMHRVLPFPLAETRREVRGAVVELLQPKTLHGAVIP